MRLALSQAKVRSTIQAGKHPISPWDYTPKGWWILAKSIELRWLCLNNPYTELGAAVG